jgi:hypothetical protein
MLYWAGDLVHRWNDDDRRFTDFGFDAYEWLMAQSSRVQGAGPGPWMDA